MMAEKDHIKKDLELRQKKEKQKFRSKKYQEKAENAMKERSLNRQHSNKSKMRLRFSVSLKRLDKKQPNKKKVKDFTVEKVEVMEKVSNEIQETVFEYLDTRKKGKNDIMNFKRHQKIPGKLDQILGYEQASVFKFLIASFFMRILSI